MKKGPGEIEASGGFPLVLPPGIDPRLYGYPVLQQPQFVPATGDDQIEHRLLAISGIVARMARINEKPSERGGQTDETFRDIIGQQKALAMAKGLVDQLKDPAAFEKFGVKIPDRIIISGKEGTGKSFFAKVLKNESGIPFLRMNPAVLLTDPNGAQLLKANVDALAKAAEEEGTKAILYIDGLGEESNAILTPEMIFGMIDSIAKSPNVKLMASTRADIPFRTSLDTTVLKLESPQNLGEVAGLLSNHFEIARRKMAQDLILDPAVDLLELSKDLVGYSQGMLVKFVQFCLHRKAKEVKNESQRTSILSKEDLGSASVDFRKENGSPRPLKIGFDFER